MTSSRRLSHRFRDLPLAWKLLLPYLLLVLVLGAAGALVIVRQSAAQAQAGLDQALTEHLLADRSAIHDRELYVLEAGNFAANLQGVSEAVGARDRSAAESLMGSVAALKGDLGLVAVVDTSGRPVGALERGAGSRVFSTSAFELSGETLVTEALRGSSGRTLEGLAAVNGRPFLAVVTPLCAASGGCSRVVGAAVVGMDVSEVVAGLGTLDPQSQGGVALFDAQGRRLAASASHAATTIPQSLARDEVRRMDSGSGRDAVATAFGSVSLGGKPLAILAVSTPTAQALGAVRDAALRLAGLLLLAMVGIGFIGIGLSRLILGQLRPLVRTSKALGQGELSARVPITAGDELGELALAVNQMASQLEASYATLESRVQERTEEVRRLMRDRNEFFAGLSHELRTPIAVILSQANLLGANGHKPVPASARRSDPAVTVKASAGQLLDVVNQILDLAKADAGGLELQLQPTDVGLLMADIRPTVDGLATAASITPDVHTAPGMVANADPVRLRQVVLNLVENATKYTPAGGRVSVRAYIDGDFVIIKVRDTGVGVPRGAEAHIFEPFYRAPGTTPQNGQVSSGLGLALARRLIEAQSGSIRVESTPGKGSTFSVVLRRADNG